MWTRRRASKPLWRRGCENSSGPGTWNLSPLNAPALPRPLSPRLPDQIWFGGDYNPEQWPEEIWEEDVRLMREAGVNVATVAVFAWSRIEPRAGVFDFAWLDRCLDLLHAHGIRVCLATATAAPQIAWPTRWLEIA